MTPATPSEPLSTPLDGAPGATPEEPVAIGRPGAYSKGVARRQEILDRAIEVFRERGSDGTSLRRIATSIGVSHAALLHYFDSREQLLVAVYQHAEAQRDATERGEEYSSGVSRAVDEMVRAAVLNVERPGLVKLYSTLVAASLEADAGPSRDFFAPRFEHLRESLTAALRSEQEAGAVRDDVDPAHIAALVIAASDGLQIQWLLEPSIALRDTLATLATLLTPPPALQSAAAD
ncbi:TetR/AcrR family transcriptional regulator [Brachybacterium sp. J144]|uniref:TetR/AcrR family transcriptional regulator n=1 Tax=Brachybacterium sp. J144 TaxID=3116487 RepID=UPI002E796094|nr:TetR/AcrR family transcriptional regulator [Brachybacterium sp. J144]MEE1649470.1 TetR/AcrR family transcriptional regulator [Brachybacterium sp. J144]